MSAISKIILHGLASGAVKVTPQVLAALRHADLSTRSRSCSFARRIRLSGHSASSLPGRRCVAL